VALLEQGKVDEAAFVLEEAVRIDPRCADAWCNLARARWSDSEFDAAEQHVRRALELAPDQAKFHYVHGLVLRDAHRPDEAEAAFGKSIQLDPYQAMTHYDLGALFVRVGRFTEAEAELRRAVDLQPQLMAAYEVLSGVRRFDSADLPEIERLERFAGQLDPQVPGRAHMEFALAKMLDDCRQYDRAFGHLRAANELKRAEVAFDPQGRGQLLQDTRRVVTGELIEEKARFGSDSDIPILVVGIPRSGTTLVEQILASHPEVSGAGEIGYLGATARSLAQQTGISYPSLLTGLGETASRDLAGGYLQRLERDRNGARHVTDKGSRNFEHLGLVSMLLPKARIVHCVRDPVDTCFSIYCQHFAWENQFAYDLEEIAAYYRFYQAMMDHWHAVLPGRIHTLRYEDLVEDQERITRGLLQHCGLSWDERCLRPHETEREIRTASHWQVRQPVYAGSVARWRDYERYLGPLVEALGDCASTRV
jgi:tetratricopeptide (TPR) repeat protein